MIFRLKIGRDTRDHSSKVPALHPKPSNNTIEIERNHERKSNPKFLTIFISIDRWLILV